MTATAPEIRVSREWLALREPADAAARSRELVARLVRSVPAPGGWVIHDLAGGTGAMGRWLAPLLPGPQHWIVHDIDADLLDLASAALPGSAADGASVSLETRRTDITQLHRDDLAGATLVTASAVLDLLTKDELAGLIAACASQGCPALLTLSVVGHVQLSPSDPLDRCVAIAFDAHQRRTTGRGRLLGPDAVGFAIEEFVRLGSQVLVQSSPWRLDAASAGLATEWFTGWVGAAREQDVELGTEATLYTRRRLAQAAAGRLAATVDHADLLALPPPVNARPAIRKDA